MNIKKLPHDIIVSFKKFFKGEENFWVTLLGWGVGFYFVSIWVFICAPILVFTSIFHFPNLWTGFAIIYEIVSSLIIQIFGILWLIFLFIYPFIFIFSIIKSSLKHGVVYVVLAFLVALIVIAYHSFIILSHIGIYAAAFLNAPIILIFSKIKSSLFILINQYY